MKLNGQLPPPRSSLDRGTDTISLATLSPRQRKRLKKRAKKLEDKSKQGRLKRWGRYGLIAGGILFPPLGIVLLITWLVHRNRPKNKARRLAEEGLLLAEHSPAAAMPLLEEAHQLDPQENSILAAAGLVAHNAEDHKMAWRFLAELGRHSRLSSSEMFLLGHSYYETDQYDKAIETLQNIPEDYDQYNKVILLLAGCFTEKEDVEAAIETLRRGPLRAIHMDDDLKELHYQLGLLHASLEDLETANYHFRRIYAADVTYRDVKERVDLKWKQVLPRQPEPDIPAQIRALAQLKQEGLLSEKDFEEKKKILLDRI